MNGMEQQPPKKILPPEAQVLNQEAEEIMLSFSRDSEIEEEMSERKSEAVIQRAIKNMIGMNVRHGQDSWKIINVKRGKKGGFDVTLVRNATVEEIGDKREKLPTGVDAIKMKDVSLSDLVRENPEVFARKEEKTKEDLVQ